MKFLDDYMQVYYNNLPKYRTYEDAYNATEEKYFGKFGVKRYKNYDVFRAALNISCFAIYHWSSLVNGSGVRRTRRRLTLVRLCDFRVFAMF